MKTGPFFLVLLFPSLLWGQPTNGDSPLLSNAWEYVGNACFTPDQARWLSLAFDASGTPYLAYKDYSQGRKASVMKYNGTAWEIVGSAGFSDGPVDYTSLAFSPAGEPFVAFQDSAHAKKCSVMKYDGISWVSVGTAGFTPDVAYCVDLAFSPSGEPYVAFQGTCYTHFTAVMKYNGSTWSLVGPYGLCAGMGNWVRLAFNLAGEPSVAVAEEGNSSKASVLRYDGANWVYVGNPGFTLGPVAYIGFAYSPAGEPYISFCDSVYGYRLSVMKFNGIYWDTIGSSGISPDYAYDPSLAISPSGEPYVSYMDITASWIEAVKTYNGTEWVDVGPPGFSGSYTSGSELQFSPSGEPYLAFLHMIPQGQACVMKYDSICSVGPAGFISGSTQICQGTSGYTYSVAPIPNAATYIWSLPPGGTITSGSGTHTITVSFSLSAQSGEVTVYGSGNCDGNPSQLPITVTASPTPSVVGSNSLCVNSGYYTYETESGMTGYQWTISPGGTIHYGSGTNALTVTWDVAGDQQVSVNYMTPNGCSAAAPTSFSVMVDSLPGSANSIYGVSIVCAGESGIEYAIDPVQNALAYAWYLPPGASIFSGQYTNHIFVNFDPEASSGEIIAVGNNLCGDGLPSPEFFLLVNPIPSTPSVFENEDTLFSSEPIGNQWYYEGFILANDTSRMHILDPDFPGCYWTQVTINGCISDTSNHFCYTPVGILSTEPNECWLWPIPTSSHITIETSSYRQLIIIDLQGQELLTCQITEPKTRIDISGFPSGVYLVKLVGAKGVQVGKFVKN